MKAFRIIKNVVIQITLFLILLVLANWVAGVYLKRAGTTNREELPNYANDQDHARKVFKDYNSVQHEYEPFVGWKMRPYKGETLLVSQDGERITPTVAQEAEQKTSVHFFGGSTMWGEGSDDQHTIPALFNAGNLQYKVYNHAQLAYNSRQELDALISLYSSNTKPDIVIFYDGVNDAAFLCPREINELPAHRLVPMYREKLYVGKTGMVKDLASKLFIENILKVIHKFTYKPTPSNSPYDCVSNPEKAEQVAEMMMKNWELAHEIVTSRNGTFLAVLQPAAYIGKPKTDHLKLDEELGRNFEEIYSRLKQKIAERKHPWIVDLTDKFDGDEYIYIDFCHVSPNGNKIIAQEISRSLNNKKPSQNVAVLNLHP